MKHLMLILGMLIGMISAQSQNYESHVEFPETVGSSMAKNLMARCDINGYLASAGSPQGGNVVYAGTTVLEWNACVMVSDSMGAELFVKQFTAVPTNQVEVLGVNFASNGNLLVLVYFWDYIVHEGVTYTSMGEGDMLLAVYDSTGVHQQTYHISGSENVILNDIDVAPNGEYRIVGAFQNDLYIDGTNTGVVSIGNQDFLLLSLNSSGSYAWSNQVGIVGGAGDDMGYSIVCDNSGNNFCALHFYGSNVPFGNGIVRTVKGGRDLVVAKYSNVGVCQSVFQFGGTNDEYEQGYVALVGTKVFFQGRVASANSFYCVNADNTIFSTFSTTIGGGRNSVFAWMDFSTGMILASGRIYSSSGDVQVKSVAAIGDTAYCTSEYGGTLTCDDGFGNNVVTFTGGGIGWTKIAVDGNITSIHQFDASTVAYGTLSDPGANRVYVALRGGSNVDLDPDPNVTVPLALAKRGVAKYDCNPIVGPTADFSGDPTIIVEGETVSFTDESTAGSNPITSWSWTFEGGTPSTSTDQNPTVTYNSPGNYDVTLEVSDGSLSDTEVKLNYIQVDAYTLAISPSSETVSAVAGSTDFTVTSNGPWTTSSDQSWAVASPVSGNGNGTVTVTYEENLSTSDRVAIITVTVGTLTEDFTLTQDADTAFATYTPDTTSVTSASGNVTSQFETNDASASNVLTGDPGASVSPINMGTGVTTVTLSYPANTDMATKQYVVTATTSPNGEVATWTIDQDGVSAFLTLSDYEETVGSNEGSYSIDIDCPTDMTWTATDGIFSTANPSTGTGPMTVSIDYEENTSPDQRVDILTFSGSGESADFTLTQVGANASLVAYASSDKSVYTEGQTIQLYGSATGGQSPYTYDWTGPGFSSSEQNPTLPAVAGENQVYTLIVTDDNGDTDTDEVGIDVFVVSFYIEVDPISGTTDDEYSFYSEIVQDANDPRTVTYHSIEFGDGESFSGAGNILETTHQYAEAGTYDIEQSYELSDGSTDSYTNVGLVGVITDVSETVINSIKIYPNPTNGTLFINAQERPKMVSIMNMAGSEVIHLESLGEITQIDLSSLPSGLYFVRITYKNQLILKKIEKK